MAIFCTICKYENAEHQFNVVEDGDTVMYCVCDLYIIGFATVINKELVENASIVNGEIRSKEIDYTESSITVIPYGCKQTDTGGAFKLRIGEFMIFSPDNEDVNEQMEYTIKRCRDIYDL